MVIIQDYDISTLKPIMENDSYAIYTLGNISETIKKGIRFNKKTKEKVEVQVDMKLTPHVIAIIRDGFIQRIH